MKNNCESFIRRALRDQRGQVLPWLTLGLVAMLGMAGIATDVGHAYLVRNQLQNAVNAAALSGAAEVYNSGADSAESVATTYLALNYNAGNTVASGYPQVNTVCLNLLLPTGTKCGGTTPKNALRVSQAVNVPTLFLRVLGFKTLTVGATATASMQGSAQPWNVAIILDATGSMGSNDPYCTTSSATAEQCAMTGIQTMLQHINPCASGTGCTAYQSNTNFRVSLFAFPNMPTTQIADEYNCGGTPLAAVYTLPAKPASGSTTAYAPIAYTGTTPYTATYQVLQQSDDSTNIDANGFTSDFFVSNGVLNSASVLVKAIGNGSKKGCLVPPSTSSSNKTLAQAAGWALSKPADWPSKTRWTAYEWPAVSYMTSFAGAIYAAQTALQAEQAYTATLGVTSRNAIIFVSDGQANMTYDGFPQKTSNASTGGVSVTSSGSSTTNLTGAANTFGTYPDFNEGCQQAIVAANDAKNAGTRFYAVAYGSEANGCVTDDGTTGTAKLVIPSTVTLNVPIASTADVVPCKVMENMASPGVDVNSAWYFYTDGSSTAHGCTDTSHTSTDLTSIFGAITTTFTNPLLLPNSAN